MSTTETTCPGVELAGLRVISDLSYAFHRVSSSEEIEQAVRCVHNTGRSQLTEVRPGPVTDR